MAKATILGSLLGRPSQSYVASDGTYKTSYSGHASDIGQSHDSYHIAQSNASGDRTVLSPSRGAASETGLDRLGAQRARTTRKHPKQHSRQIPESPLVPDLNTVNTFSRWWESRNMQKAPGQPSAASDSGESFSDRWRRDVASYSTRGHSAVSSPEAPRAVQRVGSMPKVRSTPLQLAEPKSAPKSTAGRRAAPAAHESGDWRAFVHDRATKPSWTDVHAKSYAPPKPADGPFRDSAEGELLRLSWSPALFFAQEGVEPQPSATDVLAPSAMARDVRSVAKSTFVSALDQHKQPRMEAATVPAEGAQNTLATLPWVDAPPAHGVEPPESGESATQGLLARAPLRGPSHTPAKQPAVRNVPRHVQPAPVRTITAPSHVASTLRVDKDLAHRFGAVAFNDPDILDLDPESAPWTMTSEIGHYDRSELHGSDGAEALEAPQPATPSRKMLDRTLRRGPRPTEMGGIAIAHGTLPAPSPHAGSGRIPLRTTSDSIIPPVPVPQNRFVSMPVAERLDDDDASSTETIAFVDALTNGEPGAFDVPDVPDARFGKDARLTLRSTPPATPPRAAPSIGSLSPALDAEDVFLAEDLPSSATHSAFFHFEPRDAAADALAETLQNFPEHLPGKTPTSATVSINRAPAHLRTPHAEDVQLAYLKPATDRSVSEQTTWVRSENAPATPPRSASPRPAAAMRHSPYAPVRTAPWQAHIDPTGAPYDAMPMYAQSERQRPVSAPRPLSGSALAAHEAYMQRYATPRPAVASAQSMAQGRGAVTPGGYPVPTPLRAQPSPGYAAPGHASQVPPVPPVPKAYTAVSEYTSEHPPPPPSKHGHGVEHVQRQEWQAWQEKRERAPESRAQGDGQGYAQESPMPRATAQAMLKATPKTMDKAMLRATLKRVVPRATAQAMPKAMPERAMPKATAQAMLKATPKTMDKAMLRATLKRVVPRATAQAMPKAMPKRAMPRATAQAMLKATPKTMDKAMLRATLKRVVPRATAQAMPKAMPERAMPKATAQAMLKATPKTMDKAMLRATLKRVVPRATAQAMLKATPKTMDKAMLKATVQTMLRATLKRVVPRATAQAMLKATPKTMDKAMLKATVQTMLRATLKRVVLRATAQAMLKATPKTMDKAMLKATVQTMLRATLKRVVPRATAQAMLKATPKTMDKAMLKATVQTMLRATLKRVVPRATAQAMLKATPKTMDKAMLKATVQTMLRATLKRVVPRATAQAMLKATPKTMDKAMLKATVQTMLRATLKRVVPRATAQAMLKATPKTMDKAMLKATGYGPGYAQGYAQESHAQSYGPGYAQSYAQGYGPGHAQESHAQGYNQGYEQLQPSHAQRYTQPQPSHAQHYAQSYAPTQPVPALTQPVPVQAQGYAPHSPQPVQSAPKPPMHASTPQHPGQHHPGYPPPPGTYQRPQPAMPEPRMPPAPDPMRPAAPKPNAALAMPQAQYAEPVHYPSAQRYASPQPAAPHALPSPPLTQFYAPRSGMLSPPLPTAVSPSPSSTGLSTARSARPKHAPPRAHMVLSPTERDGRAPRTSRPASPSPLDEMPLLGTVPRINSATDIAAMRNRLASPPPAERPLSPSGSVWNDGRSLRHGAPTFHSTHSFADVRGEYTPPDMETQSAASALRQYAGSPLDTREPSLAASTSILNPSTAAAMRKAPLGASTNQYLGLSGTSVPSPPQSLVGGGGGSITSSASRARMSTTDLLRNRPTMVTVNVAGQAPSGSSLRRRLSSTDGGRRRRPLSGAEAADGAAISLSSHTAPPRKISPTQVLVQVMAVAVDNVDRALLREKMQADPTHAFVPGRSFCGRVVECGWDVKRVRKGDIVFGLQDYRKCGALAEFMSIDQDLVAQAPSGPLGIEQVAALPSTGVMVHQIVQNHCMVLRKGARVLILNAHDGIGLLAMQEASRLGLIVIAHVPAHAADGISICEANGAREVVTGEALWAINLLHESSFNLIVDTVGGRHIYDACRRILAHHGQFVTCFGDDQALPTPTYRSHLRSLRRSFFRKDRKGIGYEWIGIDAGPDCRIALESIKVAAQRGAICPRIQSILPFEDAPRAFDHVPSDDPTAGVAVVRVSIAFCMRFQCRGEYGTVRYIGPLPPKEGVWFGVQFDTPGRGKHDGVGPDGVRYFTCPPGNGAFVRDTAPLEFGVLFLDALREKYAEARVPLARLETVSLTGAAPPLDDASCVYVRGAGDAAEIRATCPAIAWLDLSRSLLPDWDALAGITAALPALTTLVLHHTRLAPLQAMPQGLAHLTELKMDAAGVGWESVAHLAHLPALASLQIGYNAIHSVHPLPNDAFPALTTLNLAGNALASWDEIVAALGPLPRLRSMVLSDNRLASLFAPRHAAFAALESVCIDGNPVHAFSSLEALDAMLARPWALGMGRNAGALADRAALRLDVIARLAHLTQLNRTPVHAAERLEAERFYLAHAAPCDARFGALCRAHGAPAAPAPAPTLRAKLVDVGTACVRHMPSQEEACALLQETPRRAKLLRSMPVRLARRRLARAYSVVDTEMPMYAVLRGHAPQEPIVHWMDETQELAWYGLEDGDVIAMVRRE
ncbi:hypothetical protein MVES_000250 [Malassezia vespertilionis]|uniref:CAP-Gly domain-containing protein n=1 Tax=Malassezia vespertilionis TaxID=2020962 RepID=A0A2N1JGQ9_9BASI|nr:hypothetical protein MVES_000250 [Malassezia vespertilionis]